ncbi:MAG: ankyrin repeat domain-containing protein [Gammaproteobacteria bacterium]|nr:ankyrin repeat domain-containing protein [Gammaproteobacteria bacterium]
MSKLTHLFSLGRQLVWLFWVYAGLMGTSFAGSYEDYFQAITRDQVKTVKALIIQGLPPNTVNPQGQPALHWAVLHRAKNVVEFLLEQAELDLDQPNEHGESALMLAALTGQADLVELFISKGAEINQPGWTALHYAVTNGHLEIARYLLENAAYIDAQAPNGTTPLMMAAYYSSVHVVQFLLEQGADVSVYNHVGKNVLDYAKIGKDSANISRLLKNLILPDYLLK